MTELSINETTTFRWSFEEDALHYAAAGIPAIGVWRQKLSDFGRVKAVELLEECRLKVSHLFWAGGFTGSDGRRYDESVQDAFDAIEAAAEISAPTLVVHSGGRGGHTANHARRLMKNALHELAPEAHKKGVTLAIEPMHPGCAAEWTFLTCLDEALALLDAVGSRHAKLVLDTYHLGHDADLLDRIPQIVDRVALVQLGDARHPPGNEPNRCLLGDGMVPLPEIVGALQAAGYEGYYDFEVLGEDVEALDYVSRLEHAKQAFSDLVAVGSR